MYGVAQFLQPILVWSRQDEVADYFRICGCIKNIALAFEFKAQGFRVGYVAVMRKSDFVVSIVYYYRLGIVAAAGTSC
jgi:hypothetical protein